MLTGIGVGYEKIGLGRTKPAISPKRLKRAKVIINGLHTRNSGIAGRETVRRESMPRIAEMDVEMTT